MLGAFSFAADLSAWALVALTAVPRRRRVTTGWHDRHHHPGRQLESDGLAVTRIGSGTTVSHAAASVSPHVSSAARSFVAAARRAGLTPANAEQILRAMW